jgi:hypothetical protein
MGGIMFVEPVPAESWPRILDRLAETGIRVDDHGEEGNARWCMCHRGRALLGMDLDPTPPGTVYLYCGIRYWWSRPLATRRLFVEVGSIVRSVAGRPDS